jgi:hypothetical protein
MLIGSYNVENFIFSAQPKVLCLIQNSFREILATHRQIHRAKLPSATSSPIGTYLIFVAQRHINLATEQYFMFFASILGRRAEFM